MNYACFMGRLTGDPDIRYSQDGNPVVRFGFAVNRIYHREGEAEADFFSCVCFGKTAERFEKLHIMKGTKLLISCEVRNNDYTDKDGNKRRATQILVNNFEFCESKFSGGAAPDPEPQRNPEPANGPKRQQSGWMAVPDNVDDEGLPF